MRIFIFLLLVSLWTASLFMTPHLVKAQAEQPGGSFLGHIVQPGEDLDSIAARYQTTAAALAEKNHLSAPIQLVPGQLLRIQSWDEQPETPNAPSDEPSVHEENPQTEPNPEVPSGEKWIDIDLSEQTLTAYQGDAVVKSFMISSGVANHPTVTGTFHIWAKVARQTMTGGSRAAGDYYDLPGVPWVQYFYEDYSIHGTYWHSNFGHPMSHGCINMQTDDAQWLFEWAAPSMDAAMVTSGGWLLPSEGGTRVEVHN
jgi:lipoprotein-anchoring transpeptidase ErfK/SrfK